MHKQRLSQVPWITLILCLCLGSLVVSPLYFSVASPASSLYEIDLETSSSSDESEWDDDYMAAPAAEPAIAGSIFSRPGSMDLDFQSALLLSDPPPPK